MAVLKVEEIKKMSKADMVKKLKELKLELIKARSNANKGGTSKVREIRRIIARIHTVGGKDLKLNEPKLKDKGVEKQK